MYRYDDDVLLEEVDADFAVWEVHGRHDYTYTATAKKVMSLWMCGLMDDCACRLGVSEHHRRGMKCCNWRIVNNHHHLQSGLLR